MLSSTTFPNVLKPLAPQTEWQAAFPSEIPGCTALTRAGLREKGRWVPR